MSKIRTVKIFQKKFVEKVLQFEKIRLNIKAQTFAKQNKIKKPRVGTCAPPTWG
jgi:hypothetical protein